MNPYTMHKLSYGLYVVCAKNKDKLNGLIVNTVFQITSKPPTIAVSINKDNLTHDYINTSKEFTVSILPEETPMKLIGLFGYNTGKDIDKFAELDYELKEMGIPILKENSIAFLECNVINSVDVGTHTIFIAKVIEGDILDEKAKPMTYAYYHQVKKGKAPKNAPTYIEEETNNNGDSYECSVCGYIYNPQVGDSEGNIAAGTQFADLPATWKCPICGVGKEMFKKKK